CSRVIMKQLTCTVLIFSVITFVLFAGCGSSEKSADSQEQKSSTPTQTSGSGDHPAQGGLNKTDTLNVNVQNTQRTPYEQTTPSQPLPTGRFAVQIGAYKMADNA